MMNVSNTVMNRILFFFVFFFSISTKSIAQSEKGIRFIKPKNWAEVLTMAQAQHKSILVDVYTTWCGPCKMMDQQIYPDSALGVLVNKDFIAIKVQMDSTRNDDSYVTSWYADAEHLKQSAKIEAFPTLLFYNSEGQLVFKSMGYKSAGALSKIAAYAGNSAVAGDFKNDLLAYQNGHKNYGKLPDLIVSVREIVGDQQLALNMAKDYKNNFLDQLPPDQQISKENLDFIISNGGAVLICSRDSFFKAMYNHPQRIDSLTGHIGNSNLLVNLVISREEITDKLFKNDQVMIAKPNWKGLEVSIGQKYSNINAKEFILNEKIAYYKKIGNWDAYTHYKSEQLVANPPVVEGMNVFFALNSPAWDVFLHCTDKRALERALAWSEWSIHLEKESVQYLDTKANLLYKLGRVTEAIQTEERAIALEDSISVRNNRPLGGGFVSDFQKVIEKMKNGQATWRVPGGTDGKL